MLFIRSNAVYVVRRDDFGDNLRSELSGTVDWNASQSARVLHPLDGGGLLRNVDFGVRHDRSRLQ